MSRALRSNRVWAPVCYNWQASRHSSVLKGVDPAINSCRCGDRGRSHWKGTGWTCARSITSGTSDASRTIAEIMRCSKTRRTKDGGCSFTGGNGGLKGRSRGCSTSTDIHLTRQRSGSRSLGRNRLWVGRKEITKPSVGCRTRGCMRRSTSNGRVRNMRRNSRSSGADCMISQHCPATGSSCIANRSRLAKRNSRAYNSVDTTATTAIKTATRAMTRCRGLGETRVVSPHLRSQFSVLEGGTLAAIIGSHLLYWVLKGEVSSIAQSQFPRW